MDNRWKPWTPEEDGKILDNPESSDTSLARRMRSTAGAHTWRPRCTCSVLRFP